jgi:hypothetical protein
VLPQARTRNGVGQTTKDLSEHPWAGADVTMTLSRATRPATRAAQQPFEMRLPERPFTKPLARALIEQRRIWRSTPTQKPRADARSTRSRSRRSCSCPETNIYLGLRSIYWQLARAKSDDGLRDVVARLWAMAVTIEDGNVSDAEKALRAAQEALRRRWSAAPPTKRSRS